MAQAPSRHRAKFSLQSWIYTLQRGLFFVLYWPRGRSRKHDFCQYVRRFSAISEGVPPPAPPLDGIFNVRGAPQARSL